MSIQIDINSLGDQVALHGTEADERAFRRICVELERLRAYERALGRIWTEMERLRAELAAVREAARGAARPSAIMLPIDEMIADARRAINHAERGDLIPGDIVGCVGCHVLALIDALQGAGASPAGQPHPVDVAILGGDPSL